MVPDRFDLKILDVWQERGDIGPVEIAPLVNLSPSQCSRRMQALRKAGLVRAIHAEVEPAMIGIGISAYVLLTMKSHAPEAAGAFRKQVMLWDEVLECQALAGSSDMILKVATHDLASFNQLLTQRILAAPEVATAQSSIILENVKSTTRLPLRFVKAR